MTGQAYQGIEAPNSRSSEHNALDLMIRAMLSRVWTATIVQVRAVNAGALTVDVQPLVAQVAGDGTAVPHGTIHGAPFMRLQAGGSAILLDPVAGDIGIGLFASRDISSVKASRAAANPGSRRSHDPADCMYVGGLLNGAAQRFVRMSAAGGLELVDPVSVTVTAPQVMLSGMVALGGPGGSPVKTVAGTATRVTAL